MTLDEYVIDRIKVLDDLIAMEPEDSNHRYALMAGKYELLQATRYVTVGRSQVDDSRRDAIVS